MVNKLSNFLCLLPSSPPTPQTQHRTDGPTQADTGLPAGWEVRHSNSKNLPYYFNESQKSSRWEPPAGTDTDKLKTYMAENHSSAETRPDAAGPNGSSANGGKIRAAHLLIKHKDSRRASSWREVRIFRNLGVTLGPGLWDSEFGSC